MKLLIPTMALVEIRHWAHDHTANGKKKLVRRELHVVSYDYGKTRCNVKAVEATGNRVKPGSMTCGSFNNWTSGATAWISGYVSSVSPNKNAHRAVCERIRFIRETDADGSVLVVESQESRS